MAGFGAHTVSVVIPVYQGAATVSELVDQILDMGAQLTADSADLALAEIVLVHDCGPDESAAVMAELESAHDLVTCVWLTRNFGQHPATIAGMSASSGDWVVTMDEDGLHDPAEIPTLIEAARRENVSLVYGSPATPPPHNWHRNLTSNIAKRLFRVLGDQAGWPDFTSFRAVRGSEARVLAAYCGHGAYLDVALTWVIASAVAVPVHYRPEGRPSGYHTRTLLGHFRRMIVTSGTKPLRLIALIGLLATIAGVLLSILLVSLHLFAETDVAGWTSVMLAITVFSGLTLMALGIVAEYLAVAVRAASGRPLYVTGSGPPAGNG